MWIIVVLTLRWPRFLDRSDIAAILQQVRREGMPQGVARRSFCHAGGSDGRGDGTLDRALAQVVATALPRCRVGVEPRGREHPLPTGFTRGSRDFPARCVGQFDPAGAGVEIALVLETYPFELRAG